MITNSRYFGCKAVRYRKTKRNMNVVWTYSFRLLIREDASLSTSCEITVHFERVPGTSLVRIHPVFTWMQDREERGRKNQHCEGISKCTSTTILLGLFLPVLLVTQRGSLIPMSPVRCVFWLFSGA
uniref:Uncharacterized protein n=1 Tax=Pavo cristatus TaxID=9049 RepID=A0A8C9G4P1_PAVCR